jgi:DNA-binding CsgD family transcriptional regulator
MDQQIGADAFARRDWQSAYEALQDSKALAPLGAADLERLAVVAQLLGFDEESDRAREQAHRAYLDADDAPSAARCAFWLGMSSMDRGQMAHAGGWFGRARSILDEDGSDCAERGFVLLPQALQLLESGEAQEARRIFLDVQATARKFAHTDLLTLGRLGNGQALTRIGEIAEGTAQLDEAMISVLAGEVSPVVAGIVYCTVIEVCQAVFDLRRAQEWTEALTRWSEEQPGLASFGGKCQVYRSQLMQLHGDWDGALQAAQEAERRLSGPPANPAVGSAYYQQGELHRLRGALADADEAFRRAEEWGYRPEPGRALLRLGQGRTAAAATAISHALNETHVQRSRASLLPAAVEIFATTGDAEGCQEATTELARLAASVSSPWLDAAVSLAEGRASLAFGEPAAAAHELRSALAAWQSLDAPYEVARTRVLLAEASRAVGDIDTAETQAEAAYKEFEGLGVRPAASLLQGQRAEGGTEGLTPREVEVLRLLARGMTNRAIANSLTISEKTVGNHVGNILGKLGLSSRSAATAYAYEHGLVK